MAKITAFVARSFAPDDERKLKPILDFLDSFNKMGFICTTADRAEVESVSEKVRRMIDASDVLVGIFTRRHPVVNWANANFIERLSGNIKPEIWTAPPWVLQESGYALRAGRDLILLREFGVEVPGLQGDLEYVPFISEDLTTAFSRISEMINDLLAKNTGTTVDVVVESRAAESSSIAEAAPPSGGHEIAPGPSPELTIGHYMVRMFLSSDERDLQQVYSSYQEACTLLETGTHDQDQLAVDCCFHGCRFKAGEANGLDRLRELRQSAPQRPEPEEWIASCLFETGEYEEAARHYIVAASLLEEPNQQPRLLIKAAESYLKWATSCKVKGSLLMQSISPQVMSGWKRYPCCMSC